MLHLAPAILLAVLLFGKEFQAVCFDEEFAEVSGVPVERTLLVLLALTALAVVTLIRVVGVILALALLTIPAMIARHWSDTLRGMMTLAVPICAACVVVGLLGSWTLAERADVSLPPGPLIIVVAALLYAVSAVSNGRRRARLSSSA